MLEFVSICTYNNELWVKTYKYKTMKGVHTMNEQNNCLSSLSVMRCFRRWMHTGVQRIIYQPGQLYLLDNPLMRKPLTMDDVKKKIVGHWELYRTELYLCTL